MNKTLSIVTILVLATIAAFIFFMTFRTGDIDHKVWPVTINQLSKTEKLKIITFHKEILVGEHRISKGLFSSNEDKIYVVYTLLDFYKGIAHRHQTSYAHMEKHHFD